MATKRDRNERAWLVMESPSVPDFYVVAHRDDLTPEQREQCGEGVFTLNEAAQEARAVNAQMRQAA